MSRTTALAIACSAVLAAIVPAAKAQVREVPPFFNGNNAIFDPEISVVESGAKLDVQATVSADRKYVTMTMRPQLAQLVALREFTFQNGGPRGVVGIPPVVNPVVPNADRDRNPRAAGAKPEKKSDKARADQARADKAPPPTTAPAAPAPKAAPSSVLEREGMFRLVLQANP
jgi:hypothetical protein